jgi:hypothetical protein
MRIVEADALEVAGERRREAVLIRHKLDRQRLNVGFAANLLGNVALIRALEYAHGQ